MNKLKISILLMLYDAGEKGLTDKQIADRLDINKKGFKKLETALSEMKQHNDIAYKKGMCWIKHPEQFFKAEVTRVTPKSGLSGSSEICRSSISCAAATSWGLFPEISCLQNRPPKLTSDSPPRQLWFPCWRRTMDFRPELSSLRATS